MSERNENRPGYKKSMVGWIPVEWSVHQIGRGCRIKHGYAFSGHVTDEDRKDAPIVICIGNYSYSGGFRFGSTPLKRIKEEPYPSEYILHPGDIVLAMTCQTPGGEILGLPGIVPDDGTTYLHNQRLGLLEIEKAEHFFSNFLYYVFLTFGFNKFLYERATGTKVKHTSPGTIENYLLPLPPLPEQKKIGEILSTWDETIDQMSRLIDAKKRRKKALMQQLLTGKKRLPGFRKSWQEFFLGDVFTERREVNGNHLPLLAITGKRGVIPASEIERKDSSNPDKSRYKIIRKGDIGYNTMRMWQGVSAVSCLDGIVSPAYTICVPKADVDVQFMGYFFKFPPVVHLLWRYSQGMVNDTLNLKFNNFAQIKVAIPSAKEQCAIAKVLFSADDEIGTLEKKLIALEKQKRGLMQKLLTGEVRVKVDARKKGKKSQPRTTQK